MKQYNGIAVTKVTNPNIVNFFNDNAAVVQFNPNRGMNCIRVIFDDGSAEIVKNITVKKTYRYKTTQTENRPVFHCGDHAIILIDKGVIVLDISNDTLFYNETK